MSIITTGPPPPPPPLPQFLHPQLETLTQIFNIQKISKDETITQLRTQILRTIDEEQTQSGYLAINTFIQPILQTGPICGLVALGMASQNLRPNLLAHLEVIFETAKSKGFTRSGEMFSVKNMEILASELLECSTKIVHTNEDNGIEELIMGIVNGGFVLIPYDSLPNHFPGLRKGHTAHWAILTGVIIPKNNQNVSGTSNLLDEIEILEPGHHKSNLINFVPSFESAYVIGLHGKSKYYAIWKLKELMQSNQNLIEISPTIASKPEEFVTFPIQSSLCGLALLLYRKN